MRLQVICRESEADRWEGAADQLLRHATERKKQEIKTLSIHPKPNHAWRQLALEHRRRSLRPPLWTASQQWRPGARHRCGGHPEQCAGTSASIHRCRVPLVLPFRPSILHNEEGERFWSR